MKVRHVLSIALAPLMLAGVVGCSSSSGTKDSPDQTIKVGSSLGLAPLEFVGPDGQATGYEVDVANAVLNKLGYQIDWVNTPFEQLFTGLQTQRYRMGAAGVYALCDRVNNAAQIGTFALPIGQAGQAITVRSEDGPAIASWADLKGRTLGVESAGSTADKVAEANSGAGFTKQIYPDNNALMLALQQGRIDAAMQSSDVTAYSIKDNPKLKIAWEVPDTTVAYSFLFRQGDDLLEKVNGAIDEVRTDGTMAEIYKKYFGEAPPNDNPASPDAVVKPISPENCKK